MLLPDNKITHYSGCARAKTTATVNRALGPEFAGTVFRLQLFTPSLDGSNDKEERKLVLVTVRMFVVKSNFLNVCLYSEGTAAVHFVLRMHQGILQNRGNIHSFTIHILCTQPFDRSLSNATSLLLRSRCMCKQCVPVPFSSQFKGPWYPFYSRVRVNTNITSVIINFHT